ncbi:MAG: peptidoglycan bridge formation glycyltransferase FemA/FemB family protein [Candidatus Berkelbacteria bacterium]
MKSLLQTKEWAALRESQGWKIHWLDEILVLEKPLPFGLSFLYAPEVDFFQIDFRKFLPKIKEISVKSHSIFTRLDFLNQKYTVFNQKIENILKTNRFIKSFEEIQPEYRQIVKITGSQESILAQMKPKGRYNIKVAQKHEVVIEESKNIDDFYKIFCQTARRDGFQVRPKSYFEKLFKILNQDGLAEMLIARYNKVPVAAGIFTFYSETASYLYGASLSEHREVMAPYLLHWEAIKLAKEKSCSYYDLLAVSPFGKNVDKKLAVKYAGITRFKEQFGGKSYQTFGSYDLVHKSCWYLLFKIIEKLRRN